MNVPEFLVDAVVWFARHPLCWWWAAPAAAGYAGVRTVRESRRGSSPWFNFWLLLIASSATLDIVIGASGLPFLLPGRGFLVAFWAWTVLFGGLLTLARERFLRVVAVLPVVCAVGPLLFGSYAKEANLSFLALDSPGASGLLTGLLANLALIIIARRRVPGSSDGYARIAIPLCVGIQSFWVIVLLVVATHSSPAPILVALLQHLAAFAAGMAVIRRAWSPDTAGEAALGVSLFGCWIVGSWEMIAVMAGGPWPDLVLPPAFLAAAAPALLLALRLTPRWPVSKRYPLGLLIAAEVCLALAFALDTPRSIAAAPSLQTAAARGTALLPILVVATWAWWLYRRHGELTPRALISSRVVVEIAAAALLSWGPFVRFGHGWGLAGWAVVAIACLAESSAFWRRRDVPGNAAASAAIVLLPAALPVFVAFGFGSLLPRFGAPAFLASLTSTVGFFVFFAIIVVRHERAALWSLSAPRPPRDRSPATGRAFAVRLRAAAATAVRMGALLTLGALALLHLTNVGLTGLAILADRTGIARIEPALLIKILMSDYYYWYDKRPATSVAGKSIDEAFEALKYDKLDHWGYILSLREQRLARQAKREGYGFSVHRIDGDDLLVKLVYPGSPAAKAGLQRGQKMVAINGRRVTIDTYGEVWEEERTKPPPVKVSVQEGRSVREIPLTPGVFQLTPLFESKVLSRDGHKIGYLFYQTFNIPSTEDLRVAFGEFKRQGVKDVILDLRYNGGGLVDNAVYLASQIAGTRTRGKDFTRLTFNDRYKQMDETLRFFELRESLSAERVVVIATGNTCSASELIINGLKPHLEVVQVGDSTCGKPVGMQSVNYRDWEINPISFATVNSRGEGMYFDGLAPTCKVPDDLHAAPGDPAEAMTAEALHYLTTGRCSDRPQPLPAYGFTGRAPSPQYLMRGLDMEIGAY